MSNETPMRIVTQRDLIRRVAAAWAEQYHYVQSLAPSANARDREKLEILKQLKALDPETATAKQVAAIIGNDTWISLQCNECGTEVEQVLMFGTSGYETSTHALCAKCVHAAFTLWETRS